MSETPELLPCPFCGETVEMNDYTQRPACAWVMIHRCKVIGPIKMEYSSGERLAAAWNTRSPAPRNAALEEAAKVADHIMKDYAELTYSPHHDRMQNAAKTYCAGEIAAAIRALAEKG